jgi:nicotinamidase/pyrazinamidase
MSKNFYEYEEFPDHATGKTRRMVLLQVDIAGHSRMTSQFATDQVMEAKLELAARLEEHLELLGFKGVFWAGDGGLFAARADDATHFSHALVDAWRRIQVALKVVNDRYQMQAFSGKRVELRTSAHLADVTVHRHPRYWHSEGINFFAKHERNIGARSAFRITRTLWDALTDSTRAEFTEVDAPPALRETNATNRSTDKRLYEYSQDDGGLRSISREIDTIIETSRTYREVKADRIKHSTGNQLLIIVDVQKDFCEGGALAAERTDSLVSGINGLLEAARQRKNVAVALTCDWHPKNHASFRTRGSWKPHCIAGTTGSEFHDQLRIFDDSAAARDRNRDKVREEFRVFDIGTGHDHDYTPFTRTEGDPLAELIKEKEIDRILVAGIALDFCVAATCLDGLAHVEEVWALEEYIRPAETDPSIIEDVWYQLKHEGVHRVRSFSLSRWESADG